MSSEKTSRSSGRAVKLSFAFGELFLQLPGAVSVASVDPVSTGHVLLVLSTHRGELISVAAYRDVQALMGREEPVVWSLTATGEPVRVAEHARLPPSDPWWEGIIEMFSAPNGRNAQDE